MPNSKCLLEKFAYEENIKILPVQETLTSNPERLHFLNMNCIADSNESKNRGAALYVSHEYTITKLDKLSKLSTEMDSAWGLAIINNTRYIMGSIYVKRNYHNAIPEVIHMLNEAHNTMLKMKAAGVMLFGDFNARHVSWGDTKNDTNGNALIDELDYAKFSICSPKRPTFLSVTGSSCIDFVIVSNNLTDNIDSIRTDDEIELFSGAPRMGHIPVIFNINKQKTTSSEAKSNHFIVKLDIKKINWNNWTLQIEQQIEKKSGSFQNEDDPEILWAEINNIILDSTKTHGGLKRTSKHSKPYWSKELTDLSDKLRLARKAYKQRNTDSSYKNLVLAKENFEQRKQSEGKDFILKRTSNLNSAQAKNFWKEFNKMFKKKLTIKWNL